jgi:hypothetical protein
VIPDRIGYSCLPSTSLGAKTMAEPYRRYYWDFIHDKTGITGYVIEDKNTEICRLMITDGHTIESATKVVDDLNSARITAKSLKHKE